MPAARQVSVTPRRRRYRRFRLSRRCKYQCYAADAHCLSPAAREMLSAAPFTGAILRDAEDMMLFAQPRPLYWHDVDIIMIILPS